MFRRWSESLSQREHVICVQRWRVARVASFTLEDLLAFGGSLVERIRIFWGLQRIKVERQGVELVVAIAAVRILPGILWERGKSERQSVSGRFAEIPGERVGILVHGGIAHEIADAAMADQTCCIQILPVLDAYQIGNLGGQRGVGSVAGQDSRGDRAV